MKRLKNLYENLYDIENVKEEYKKIRMVNKNKKSILNYEITLNANLINISNVLYKKNYSFKPYNIFIIREPKYRLVMNQAINDKLINHLAYRYILNKLDRCLINENVATRKDKGTAFAFDLVINYINQLLKDKKEIYILKIDISKYFYNIDHELLKEKLKRKIKDKDALELLFNIIDTTNVEYVNKHIEGAKRTEINNLKFKKGINKEKNIEEIEKIPYYKYGKGLPIGNVTSQFMAIFYLNDIDHYIKEKLKHKYYIRYMDDLVIIDTDKEKLKKSLKIIIKLLEKEKLDVNKKTKIYSLRNGFSFVGYKFLTINGKLNIKYNSKTIRRIDRKLKKIKNVDYNMYYKSMMSYQGYFDRTQSNLKEKFKKEVKSMYDKYLNIKKDYKRYVVLVKKGNFYYSYDDDALIINYLFDYKIIDNKIGFPLGALNKVQNRLKKEEVSSAVLEGNDIVVNRMIEEERYSEVLGLSHDKLERIECENKLIEMIKEKLLNNINHYESIANYIRELN